MMDMIHERVCLCKDINGLGSFYEFFRPGTHFSFKFFMFGLNFTHFAPDNTASYQRKKSISRKVIKTHIKNAA